MTDPRAATAAIAEQHRAALGRVLFRSFDPGDPDFAIVTP